MARLALLMSSTRCQQVTLMATRTARRSPQRVARLRQPWPFHLERVDGWLIAWGVLLSGVLLGKQCPH
eukprot:8707814-Lingulodinium_polyedra.AAC.1